MDLASALNSEAHGHIHELLGGAWSTQYGAVAERTSGVILPFLHIVQV